MTLRFAITGADSVVGQASPPGSSARGTGRRGGAATSDRLARKRRVRESRPARRRRGTRGDRRSGCGGTVCVDRRTGGDGRPCPWWCRLRRPAGSIDPIASRHSSPTREPTVSSCSARRSWVAMSMIRSWQVRRPGGLRRLRRPGVQVVHPEDVQRAVVRALIDADTRCGTIGLAANGTVTVREVAEAAGRRCIRIPQRNSGQRLPVITTDYQPVWTAQDCVEDFRLAVGGVWHSARGSCRCRGGFRGFATFLRRMFPPRMG